MTRLVYPGGHVAAAGGKHDPDRWGDDGRPRARAGGGRPADRGGHMSEGGAASFVASRQFGRATVSVICEGLTTARLGDLLDLPVEAVRAAVPQAGPDGEVE